MSEPLAFPAPLCIGVISDTHIYDRSRRAIPPEVIELFRRAQVGLIVHAGDINQQGTLDVLGELAPVIAVYGNNDDRALQAALPRQRKFTVGSIRFGLVHGHGGKSARVVAKSTFDHPLDCVIYGHSHRPLIEEEHGVVYFNPGSPTDRRFGRYFGVGLIFVNEEGARPDLVLFEDPAHLANVVV